MIHGSYLNLTSSDMSPSANLTLSERSDDEIAIILPKNHGLSDFPLYGGYLQKTSEFTFKRVVEEDILNLILYQKIRNSKIETDKHLMSNVNELQEFESDVRVRLRDMGN